MNSDRNCHFTWVEHQENLVSLVQSLYDNESFFDCKLYADGHHFDVHRLILSSCSPYLNLILQEHKSDNPVITLDGVSSEELRALVEYMYTGETSIAPDLLNSFFQTTKLLDIAGLSHYNNDDVDQILNGDETGQTTETGFQFDYGSDNQNILKYLEQSVEGDEVQVKEELSTLSMESRVLNVENMDGTFQDEETLEKVSLKEEPIINSKHRTVILSGHNLTQALITNSDDEAVGEVIDDMDETSEIYNYSTVFMKEKMDHDGGDEEDEENSLAQLINSDSLSKDCDSDGRGENDFWNINDESQINDEDAEKYVFVKVDTNTLQRVKGNQIAIKQGASEISDDMNAEKYYKVIGPSKRSILIKRPKIQNVIAQEPKSSPDDKKIYICLKCGNKYSHRRTLLHHIHWICDQPATYSCTLCPYMGKRKFQLKSHMKHAHLLRMS